MKKAAAALRVLLALLLLQLQGTALATVDKLWLRFPVVQNLTALRAYRRQLNTVAIIGSSSQDTLRTVARELEDGLSGLLGQPVPTTCCNKTAAVFVVEVDERFRASLGREGFRLESTKDSARIEAGGASGAFYGAFELLSLCQRALSLPTELTSSPSTKLRIWNLWDELTGSVTRGYAGNSLVWPYALYRDDAPPPRAQLFFTTCNTSDPHQRWEGATLEQAGAVVSAIKNVGTGRCLGTARCEPVEAESCENGGARFLFNATNGTISVSQPSVKSGPCSHSTAGSCLDVNGGFGPDIILYRCHERNEADWPHQVFAYVADSGAIRVVDATDENRCLTLERTTPPPVGTPSPWSGAYKRRFEDTLRLLKSTGVNGVVLNDVNACGANTQSLESETLINITRNLRPIFVRLAMTPWLSVCFGAPTALANITSDPDDEESAKWWTKKVKEIYLQWPELGGFLVKADSEGNVGPSSFNRTQAEGANALARALAPHGGRVIWRAFVYGVGEPPVRDEDLARQAFDTFIGLDGAFDENVVLQIKNGPIDFQVREPLSPLLGALRNTPVMMELQATQEYTGQQIHAVGLASMWEEYLSFDTWWEGKGSTIARLLSGEWGMGVGLASVSNLGNWANWTGSVLSASNTYAFGRLAWDPTRTALQIHTEWAARTFPPLTPPPTHAHALSEIVKIMQRSWNVYEGYFSPLGMGFLIADWINPCECYDFNNATHDGIGCDRTSDGVGSRYAATYSPVVASMFSDPITCPEELLLFFHNLPYDHPMSGGSTLIERIRNGHADAVREANQLAARWEALRGAVDAERWAGVRARFAQQVNDAAIFANIISDYFGGLAMPARKGILPLTPAPGCLSEDSQVDLWCPGSTGVAPAQGDEEYKCYKIPTLLRTGNGTLLAFIEGRRFDCNDQGQVDLRFRRSLDDGATWLHSQLLYSEPLSDNGVTTTIGDACPVQDTVTGGIHVIFTRNNADVFYTRSDDEGASFSNPVNISAEVDGHREGNDFIGTGHGGGVELASGRLIVPMHGPCHMIYSDDQGKTWAKAPGAMTKGGECQVAEIRPGLLIVTGRNDNYGFTEIAYSSDDGMTWSESKPNRNLPSPIEGVEASLVAHPNGKLYHSSPNSFIFRRDMRVMVSTDDGASWSPHAEIWPGAAGYSSLAVLGDDENAPLGLLYDRNNHTMVVFEAQGVSFTTFSP